MEQRSEEIKAYQPYTGPERRMSHSTQNQIIKRKQAKVGFILGLIALLINAVFFAILLFSITELNVSVLGILAIAVLFVSLACSIIGLIMSIRGLKCKRYGMALAGIILNSAAILSTIVATIILGMMLFGVAPYLREQIMP